MFLFSWFKHPLSRLYICLKVALCARLLRCKSLATPFCPTIPRASFSTATCWIALVLLIAKFLHCRGNEVVALQTSAILLPRLLPGSRSSLLLRPTPSLSTQRKRSGRLAILCVFATRDAHLDPGAAAARDKKNAHGISVGICLIFEPTVISLMMIVKGLTII